MRKAHGRKSKARISQCMIVKNEESNIERALSWGKGIVSEQIVVDTGSTDKTAEIARRMGAKVYEFEWINDFAVAKNYAISKAKYEWIAFLDADEYMSAEDAEKLLTFLNEMDMAGTEALLTAWVNLDDEGKVTFVGAQRRVFRNLPTLRYEGRIHECLNSTDGHSFDTLDMVGELNIFHTGYGDTERRKKEGRNRTIIEEELEQKPDSYDLWGYMGQEYAAMGEWEKAVEAFEKGISLIPEEMKGIYDVSTSTTGYRLLEVAANVLGKDEGRVMEIYEMVKKSWPEESDYDYCVGRYYADRGEWPKAEYHVRMALGLLEEYGNTHKGMLLSGEIQNAYELLAKSCYHTNNLTECVQVATILLKDNPYHMGTAVILLSAFGRDGEEKQRGRAGAEEVAAFLGSRLYDWNVLKDRIFVLRAAVSAGYADLVEVVGRLLSPEELEAVLRAYRG